MTRITQQHPYNIDNYEQYIRVRAAAKGEALPAAIDWQAVLLAYMKRVYEVDHIAADPDWENDDEVGISGEPLSWLRERYAEMLKQDGMCVP